MLSYVTRFLRVFFQILFIIPLEIINLLELHSFTLLCGVKQVWVIWVPTEVRSK